MVILEIDEEMNPWIKEYDTVDKCHYLNSLLNIGHTVTSQLTLSSSNEYTEKLLELQNERNADCVNSSLDAFREMISTIASRMDSIEQRTNSAAGASQQKMLEMVELFTGKTKTSSTRGEIGETCIEEHLEKVFPNDSIVRTSGQSHEADIQLISSDSANIIIESKNYTSVVQTKEIEKFKSDMKRTNYKFGLFISLNSKITGKKSMEIEQFDGGIILYLSDMGFHMEFITLAINVLKNIAKLTDSGATPIPANIIKDNINYIAKTVQQLPELLTNLTKARAVLCAEETNIRASLDNIHSEYIRTESEVKLMIENIQNQINYKICQFTDINSNDIQNIDSLINGISISIDDRKRDQIRAVLTQICLRKYAVNMDNTNFNILKPSHDKIISKLSIKGKLKLSIIDENIEIDLTKKNSISCLETYFQILEKI
jgi:hypothetical protein